MVNEIKSDFKVKPYVINKNNFCLSDFQIKILYVNRYVDRCSVKLRPP